MSDKLRDEAGRLRALRNARILDTPPETAYDHLTRMVRNLLDVPVGAVSFIDTQRQWFKAISGLDVTETPREHSFCTVTIQRDQPLVVEDATEDERFRRNALVVGPPHIRSYVGMPIASPDGYQLGALCAIDFRPRRYSEEALATLRDLARCAEREVALRLAASLDALTGVLNRAAFFEQLERLQAGAGPADCALAMIDLDHFKHVNDTFGHAVGDDVLRRVGEVLAQVFCPVCVLGRLGGEEFAALIPQSDTDDVFETLSRAMEAVSAITVPSAPDLRVSTSIGFSTVDDPGGDFASALREADAALYAAKRAGRNRVCGYLRCGTVAKLDQRQARRMLGAPPGSIGRAAEQSLGRGP